MLKAVAVALVMACTTFIHAQTSTPAVPVTEISADLGSCRVDFKVTDMQGKPIYNAKISTTIRYGFLGKRKLSLEAATNSDGRARFITMPERVREPLEFTARHGDDVATLTWDPGNNCRAEYPILMGKKPETE